MKIWIVGARGAIASTLAVGTLAAQRGLVPLEGLLTETPPFQGLGLASLDAVEFGGCDLIPGALAETAQESLVGVGSFPPPLIDALMPELAQIRITRGILRGGGPTIDALALDERAATASGTARAAVERIAGDIRTFADGAPTVVVNLASTEPPPAAALFAWDATALEEALDADDPRIPASLLYAYASVQAGCPYANFTPSAAASLPSIVALARAGGLPVAGRDGKTGETLLQQLELRLDNVVFRMGFADTRSEARQLVRHGHFTVNAKRVNIPSFSVKPGTVIEVHEKSKKVLRIQEAIETVDRRGIPQWIEVDKKALKGTVRSVPNREDLTMPIQEQLIVELYSK